MSRTLRRKQQSIQPSISLNGNKEEIPNARALEEEKMRAKDAISIIGFLNGENDIGVEEFIKCIKRAQLRCSQPHALLDMIISERIRENAEKAVKFMKIHSYEDLETILRANVKPAPSITSLRSKLESCRRGNNETVQYFNVRFKQLVNEIRYGLLSKSMNPTERMARLKVEE